MYLLVKFNIEKINKANLISLLTLLLALYVLAGKFTNMDIYIR